MTVELRTVIQFEDKNLRSSVNSETQNSEMSCFNICKVLERNVIFQYFQETREQYRYIF